MAAVQYKKEVLRSFIDEVNHKLILRVNMWYIIGSSDIYRCYGFKTKNKLYNEFEKRLKDSSIKYEALKVSKLYVLRIIDEDF